MPIIKDDEFGDITVRRSQVSRQVRISVAPNGKLRASMPPYTPMIFLKKLIKSSREELRQMIEKSRPETNYFNGQAIGKKHSLIIQTGQVESVVKRRNMIVATVKDGTDINSSGILDELRGAVIKSLRSEAKDYLPKRLNQLAQEMGCSYERVRFSHASSRWGSCSSTGTISLNIALMKLPFELIDYVIIHELAHTVQMNHSSDFWDIVRQYDSAYKQHRNVLKSETPSI